ncbi:hypothetical protein [Leadbetterella byssophila]|uniref:Lipoprotein n=1 Tax=Leadbetterella byssophila (strain DSM 17132 / JCM 16389 / KACC 11308 / NBRC 106382 / 4M15) TaxID=649349 RepID=E4RUV0_LEAB4|nr:hypothetical protein [Leadbetterella byssophila]ADQ16973.1 hypothetical protein Lbys_1253 [Leadbetterella byssophila DSM 17132]
MKNLFYALIFFAFSCQSDSVLAPLINDIAEVKSGQSFGMCVGKCHNELVISGEKVTLIQKGVSERGGDLQTSSADASERLDAIKKIFKKFKKSDFLKLNEVYGCPDCADGGAEWLSLKFKDGKVKKVSFEYGSTLPGFEEIISALRTERLSLIEKNR